MRLPFNSIASFGVAQTFVNDAAYVAAFPNPTDGVFYFNSTDGQYRYYFGGVWAPMSGAGTVTGPGSSTDRAIPRWNGTTGNALLDSSVILDDSDNILFTDGTGNIGSTDGVTPNRRPNTLFVKQAAYVGGYDASAALGAFSTTQGLLMPSMTTTQKNAISSPAIGLQVFDNVTNTASIRGLAQWYDTVTTTLPSTLKSIPNFTADNGLLSPTGIAVGTNTSGGLNNLFWFLDDSSDVGRSDLYLYSPDTAPNVILAPSGVANPSVMFGGAFVTSSYLNPYDSSYLSTLDSNGMSLTNVVTGLPFDFGVGGPTGSFIADIGYDPVNKIAYVTGSFTSLGFTPTTSTVNFGSFDLTTGQPGAALPTIFPTGGPIWVDPTDGLHAYIYVGGLQYGVSTVPNLIRVNLPGGAWDTAYNVANASFDGPITDMMQDPASGKLVVVGNFTMFGATPAPGIIRLNTDGTVDGTFNPGTGFDGQVNAIAISATRYYAGGSFVHYDGNVVNSFVGILSTGAYDPSFPAGVLSSGNPGVVYSIPPIDTNPSSSWTSFLPIWVGGQFDTYNGNSGMGNILWIDETGAQQWPSASGTQPMSFDGIVKAVYNRGHTFNDDVFMTGNFSNITDIFGIVSPAPKAAHFHIDTGSAESITQQFLTRPANLYVAEALNVGPSNVATSYVNIINTIDSGLRGVVNTMYQSNPGTSPAWIAQKAEGTLAAPTRIAGDSDELTMFLARGYNGGAFIDMASMRVHSDNGNFGTRFDWMVTSQNGFNSNTRTLWHDSFLNLNIGGGTSNPQDIDTENFLFSFDGVNTENYTNRRSIGNIYPPATLTYMNQLKIVTKLNYLDAIGSSQSFHLQPDGAVSPGGEFVVTTGTVQLGTLDFVVHVPIGGGLTQDIVNAINNDATANQYIVAYNLGFVTDFLSVPTNTHLFLTAESMGRPAWVNAKTGITLGGEFYKMQQFAYESNGNTPTNAYTFSINYIDGNNEFTVRSTILIEVRVVGQWLGGSSGSSADYMAKTIKAVVRNVDGTPVVDQFYEDGVDTTSNIVVDVVYVGVSGYQRIAGQFGQTFAVQITGPANTFYEFIGTVIIQKA
jgi:hypothetical protein